MEQFWYLVYTKPKEEERALLNLERQGYRCYLPRITVERCAKSGFVLKASPLFPRYIFVQIPEHLLEPSWVPIRSTLGVSNIVLFGGLPAQVPLSLIDALKALEAHTHDVPRELFASGEHVMITSGPFSGIEAVFKMRRGSDRVIVLITLLHKQVPYTCEPSEIRKIN